ncbi:MAG: AraC family transcriptional regulator [Lentisphaeria bacterium]|jgi:AraC-like DNA-binding protein
MADSPEKRAKTAAKQPSLAAVAARYDPVELPADFPCVVSGVFRLSQVPFPYVHRHNCLELNLCYRGSGICVAGHKMMAFGAGDAIVLSGGEMHMAGSLPGADGEIAWILLDPIRLLGPAGGDPRVISAAGLAGPDFTNVLHPGDHPEITSLMRLLFAEMHRQAPGYREIVRGLVWSLMGLFHRLPGVRRDAVPEGTSALDDLTLERLRPALERMLNHLQEPLEMNRLAGLCHLSPVTFRRLFRALAGESPLRYLNHLRVQTAAAMLDGSRKPISEIARSAGYPSLSNFNRHFRRHTGLSPRSWRQRNAPGQEAG